MTTMVVEIYDALREVGVAEGSARRAAQALAGHEPRLAELSGEIVAAEGRLRAEIAAAEAPVLAKIAGVSAMTRDRQRRAPAETASSGGRIWAEDWFAQWVLNLMIGMDIVIGIAALWLLVLISLKAGVL